MLSILIYLDIESVCQIDVAVTNTTERVIWLTILSANYFGMFSEHEHCEESIRWLVKRGIRLESLKVRYREEETEIINVSTIFISSVSSNVVKSNIEIIESESVASQFHSQNSEYKKNITTSDKKGKRNKIGVNDCHNNHNNTLSALNEIRSKEAAAQSNNISSQIKEKNILLLQSVPRDDSDSSDSEM